MNTRIRYLYRDANNFKKPNECIVSGSITTEQVETILECADGYEWFIPKDVGLPAVRFEKASRADHPWFELREDSFEATEDAPTVGLSVEELVRRFLQHKDNWSEL